MGKINVQKFDVLLPEKSAADVVQRILTVGGSGPGDPGLQSVFTLDFGLGESGPPSVEVTVLEGLTGIEVSLIDVDNAGNKSEASTFSFDSGDTQAPPAPGSLGVQFKSEEIIEVP